MLSKISNQIKKWFSKDEATFNAHLPKNQIATFYLIVDDLKIAQLSCKDGLWTFKYTEEFKKKINDYSLITGFPDINKQYQSDHLWPFFNTRIPGLKQPQIQEILQKEHIDPENEFELLKRFGKKTISNPYKLVLS
jgi:HipA-like protein